MSKKLVTKRTYPWTGEIGGRKITFQLMTADDREAALAFTAGLSHADTLFLQSDITKPEVIDEWIENIGRGRAIILLAVDNSENVVGYASLYHNEMTWKRHQGEVRLFVRESVRGTGVGRQLTRELAEIAEEQHLDIIVANIPRDRTYLRLMFEKVGFTVEALLADWLMDVDGKTHDLLVMARRVKDF
jgi:L-amino acid N-acyltransferase YncA